MLFICYLYVNLYYNVSCTNLYNLLEQVKFPAKNLFVLLFYLEKIQICNVIMEE